MRELPHDLAGPLHLLEPWWQRSGCWWALALTLALLGAWLLLRRGQQPAETPAVPRDSASKPTPVPALVAAIRELRDRYAHSGDLREGLHRLALLLRRHFTLDLPAAERGPGRTGLEVAERLAEGAAARADLLRRLSDLQFGRREPTGDDFGESFRIAEQLAASRWAGAGRRKARRPTQGGQG